MLAEPIAYRDDRTAKPSSATSTPSCRRPSCIAINGLQFLPFNTIYQLAAETARAAVASRRPRSACSPTSIAYWLTGELRTELTNASTTGLLDVRTQRWSDDASRPARRPSRPLRPIWNHPGSHAGPTVERGSPSSPSVRTTPRRPSSASLRRRPTSPTSQAAHGPSSGSNSTGRSSPKQPRAANFTNELGVDGRIRFLRNVGGLWLLQECLRSWQRHGLDDLLGAAAHVTTGGPRIDVDDPTFIAPGEMPERIATAAGRPHLTPAETVRCILDSLASAYARTVEQAAVLAGRSVEVLHVVGGGSQNELLCQLTADAAQAPVVAGPVEATALGNILVQARAHGCVPTSLDAIRADVSLRPPTCGGTTRREPLQAPSARSSGSVSIETDPIERRLARAASVADLRRIAKRRLPGGVFDYIDGGPRTNARSPRTSARSPTTTFRPRVLRGIEKVDIDSTLLGRPLAFPLVLAPTGFTPHRRPRRGAGRRSRRGARRAAVHAVHAEHPLDRGGPRR